MTWHHGIVARRRSSLPVQRVYWQIHAIDWQLLERVSCVMRYIREDRTFDVFDTSGIAVLLLILWRMSRQNVDVDSSNSGYHGQPHPITDYCLPLIIGMIHMETRLQTFVRQICRPSKINIIVSTFQCTKVWLSPLVSCSVLFRLCHQSSAYYFVEYNGFQSKFC